MPTVTSSPSNSRSQASRSTDRPLSPDSSQYQRTQTLGRSARQGPVELARVARVTSLGALTASIAHEVNQPLSGIITNASTCLRMLAADPPNVAAPGKPRGARFAMATVRLT